MSSKIYRSSAKVAKNAKNLYENMRSLHILATEQKSQLLEHVVFQLLQKTIPLMQEIEKVHSIIQEDFIEGEKSGN